DPRANSAVHAELFGLVVGRMGEAQQAVLVPAGLTLFSRRPRFLLRDGDQTLAAVWFPSPGHMDVRASPDMDAALIGRVDAAWQQGAISLTITQADGSAVHTSVFQRLDAGVPGVLTWYVPSVLNVR